MCASVVRVTARTSDKVRAQVVRLLSSKSPPSVPDIAKKLGVSESWVRRVGAAEGIQARPVGRPPGTVQPPNERAAGAKADAVTLHKQGMSPKEIALELGRSSRTIYLYLQEARDEKLIK